MRRRQRENHEKHTYKLQNWESICPLSPWEQSSRNINPQNSSHSNSEKINKFLSKPQTKVYYRYSKSSSFFNTMKTTKSSPYISLQKKNKDILTKSVDLSRRFMSRERTDFVKNIQLLKFKTIQPNFDEIKVPKFRFNTKQLTKMTKTKNLKETHNKKLQISQKGELTCQSLCGSIVLQSHIQPIPYQKQPQRRNPKNRIRMSWFALSHKLNRSTRHKITPELNCIQTI